MDAQIETADDAGVVATTSAEKNERAPKNSPMESMQPSVTSKHFLRHGIDVRVANCEGFLCKLRMKILIDMDPQELYQLLTHEDNSAIFRTIDAVTVHKVRHESEDLKEVYVEQTATVGALFFKQTFTTALNVTEYPKKLSAAFDLDRPGMMTAFQGHWTLTGVPPAAYMEMIKRRKKRERWQSNPRNTGPNEKTLMFLEQDVAPAIVQKVPPLFHGIMRKLCAGTCSDIYKDLTIVAELRKSGLAMETILNSRVHGRGGLARKVLNVPRAVAEPLAATNRESLIGMDGADGLAAGSGEAKASGPPIQSYQIDLSDED